MGYRVAIQGNKLVLSLGYSHPLNTPTAGITFKVDEERKIFCIFLGLINSSLDKRLLKFVNSASLNLIKGKELNTTMNISAARQVRPPLKPSLHTLGEAENSLSPSKIITL